MAGARAAVIWLLTFDWTTCFSLELFAPVILYKSGSAAKPLVWCIAAVWVSYVSAVHDGQHYGYFIEQLTDSDLYGYLPQYVRVPWK